MDGGLVIAVAETGNGRLRVRLVGDDAVGDVSFDETYPAEAARDGAAAAFAALETRWKTTQQGGILEGRPLAPRGGLDQPSRRRDGLFHGRNLLKSASGGLGHLEYRR